MNSNCALRKIFFILLALTVFIFFTNSVSLGGALPENEGDMNIERMRMLPNFIVNSKFVLESPDVGEEQHRISAISAVKEWTFGEGNIQDTAFMIEAIDGEEKALGIKAGNDRQGKWRTMISACEPGEIYRFEGDFYRYDRYDPSVYPEVKFWGKKYKLNTHRMYGRFQRLFVEMYCPEEAEKKKGEFVFINSHPGVTFWMKNPSLIKLDNALKSLYTIPRERFFPIGVYGANPDNLTQIKENGFTNAVIQLNEKNVQTCLDVGIHCTLGVPREPEKLQGALVRVETLLQKGNFSFYVNDEPGIHSFPVSKARAIQEMLKESFPESFTNMAIVRPQVIPEYSDSADYFMLDQYPVPHMPMTWLSDSMDEAAEYVGRGRLHSVIQAFGGEEYESSGWPRLPTFEEMNCLSFLSVIHGSRGIYFYTYPAITATKQGRRDIIRLVQRLNSMRSWLLVHNEREQVRLEMTSDYKYGPKGKPAVHCTSKEQYNTRMLICVNTLRTYTEAEVDVAADRSKRWQDYYSNELYYVAHGNLFIRFDPLEVKVLLESR